MSFRKKDRFESLRSVGVLGSIVGFILVIPALPIAAAVIGLFVVPLLAINFIYRDFYKKKFTLRNSEHLVEKDFGGLFIANENFEDLRAPLTSWAGSKIIESNFEGAKLNYADFEGAALKDVSFKNADLRGANLSQAIMKNVDLEGAEFSKRTRLPFSEQEAIQLGMEKVS